MKFRSFLIGGLIAAILQTGALAKIIYDRATFLQEGREVVLATGFVDPRDLFRGHYVTLNLLISTIEAETIPVPAKVDYGDQLYVELTTGGDLFATAKSVTLEYPAAPTGPVIKGTSRTLYSLKDGQIRNLRVTFPFDRYFAPKLQAKKLENLRRDRKLGVILVLDGKGNGAIKGITIDGEKVYEEPLY